MSTKNLCYEIINSNIIEKSKKSFELYFLTKIVFDKK